MGSSILVQQPTNCFNSNHHKLFAEDYKQRWLSRNTNVRITENSHGFRPIRASSILDTSTLSSSPSSFPLLQPQLEPEDSPASQLEPADPDFYRIGYVRSVRAYGVEFKEGPDGFGVYASKDIEPLRRARVIMEIPLELMLTISKKLPWMFFPDIIPVGHPIFDIINSTNPEIGT